MRIERTHFAGTCRTPAGPLRCEPTGLARLWRIVRDMNPSGNTVNCGHSVDVVIHRLSGTNPTAVSHNIGSGGSFTEIATRHGTTFTWQHSLDEIFNVIRSGGHGTLGLVGMLWTTGSSHIVAIANVEGIVGICEGQDWAAHMPPQVLSDMDKVHARYNPTGNEVHGLAVVRWGALVRSGWEGAHTDLRALRPHVPPYRI